MSEAKDADVDRLKLLPCPFCGGVSDFRGELIHKYQIECSNCNTRGASFVYSHAAVEAWNRRQSLSQEAVRDEVLEEILDRRCTNPKPVGDSACDCCQHHWFAILGHTPIEEYRALKREPNASYSELGRDDDAPRRDFEREQYERAEREPNAAAEPHEYVDAPTGAIEEHGPAPAAPDVASMVKRLNNLQAYLEKCLTSPTKTCEEAAALLAKLGQGWIPVSERLPQDNTSPVLVNYRAAFHTRKFASGKAKRHRVMFAIFSGGKWRFTLKHEKTRLSERVTHWMPLPPAPGASDD